MPELPEVQNFANALNKSYSGLTFRGIQFHRKNLRYPLQKKELNHIFDKGQSLLRCYREGKKIVLQTTSGFVDVSLGMTGYFRSVTSAMAPENHQHITIHFENGSSLAYIDPRRFGYWLVKNVSQKELLTPSFCDPLCEKSLKTLFYSKLISSKNVSVKSMLMNQKIIGGIGNIYALEALFEAGISPLRSCSKILRAEWEHLAYYIPLILNKAIENGGSSISTYRQFEGEKGGFQKFHKVYDKEEEACMKVKCAGIIVRVSQEGRSSWYCPNCQK